MMIFHSEKLPEGRSNSISDVFALSDHLGGTAQEPQEPWPLICWPSSSCQGERWNLSAPVERWRCWHSFDHMMWSPMVGFTVWLVYLWMKPTKYIYIFWMYMSHTEPCWLLFWLNLCLFCYIQCWLRLGMSLIFHSCIWIPWPSKNGGRTQEIDSAHQFMGRLRPDIGYIHPLFTHIYIYMYM